MHRTAFVLAAILSPSLIGFPSLAPRSVAADVTALHKPDAKAVQRYGPAYRYPQAGWIVVHVEGDPYPRGYQQGRLLASEIAGYTRTLARDRNHKDPEEGWKTIRTLTNALFLRKFDREFLEEMKGIADGAAAAGAKFGDRSIDLIDIAAANVWQEIDTLDEALAASPTGLEGVTFPKPASTAPVVPKKDHCSAFAATGPATADGRIVFGHITMFGLHFGPYVNVWIDCQPTKGRRFVMQGFPGAVWSSQDYYQNDAGILLCETTISQTPFDAGGEPLTTRARKAIQYAESIDDVVKLLSAKNNGLYTNEWLIADIKTNEIAMFELGTKKTRLWRSSRDEWFGGAKGFYWGCNNTKDLNVRLEALPLMGETPPEPEPWTPSARDKAWLRFFDKYHGKIDADAGKAAFGCGPLAAPSSLDAKITTTTLAKDLAACALYGPPTGRTWVPTDEELQSFPDIRPLVSHPWTVITINPPVAAMDGKKPVDLPDRALDPMTFADRMRSLAETSSKPAWTGTVTPKGNDSVWLIAAMTPYARIVGAAKTIEEREGAAAAAESMEMAVFRYRSSWRAAHAAEPAWRRAQAADANGSPKPTDVVFQLDRERWLREQIGRGVVMLHALRQKCTPESFDAAMAAFGRAYDRKSASIADLATIVKRETSQDLPAFLAARETVLPPAVFSTRSFRDEVEGCLIVYGTADDVAANKCAAEGLQELIRRQCLGTLVPVVADTATADADLAERHLLLIGGPGTNRISAKCAAGLPASFVNHTFMVRGETYANANTCVIAARSNPLNSRYSATILAGLSAAATCDAPEVLMASGAPAAEILVVPATGRLRAFVVSE